VYLFDRIAIVVAKMFTQSFHALSKHVPGTINRSRAAAHLIPRMERMVLSLSRSGPLAHALAGLDIALWEFGDLPGVPISTLVERVN
jgi:L-alanine-DL-glutamate epimerase-like enolase superfamily enzyme